MSGKVEKVVPLDIGFLPEAAVTNPVVLQTDYRSFLTFNAVRPVADNRREAAGTAVIEFARCSISKFGYPNDEALPGNPLYLRGLDFYGVFEVLNPSWILQITEQNRVRFPATKDSAQRHYVFTFHDSTFECIADSMSASLSEEPFEQIYRAITRKAFPSEGDLIL